MNWRDRDNEILSRAKQHVCCPRHFFDLFGTPQAAYRRLARLVALKQLRVVGEIMVNDSGRPQKCFCNGYKPKPDQARHETLLTDLLFCYPEAEVVRGWLVDKTLRPDAEMVLGGIKFNVELDTGTESHSQVRRRQRAYVGTSDLILFATLSERRLRGLQKKCLPEVASLCLFAVLSEVQANPHGPVWRDWMGNRVQLGDET